MLNRIRLNPCGQFDIYGVIVAIIAFAKFRICAQPTQSLCKISMKATEINYNHDSIA